MTNNLELVLYTRPTCSDCQDAKTYLASHAISYHGKDVAKDVSLEQEMIEISGNRIVPLFAFYKKGILGKKKLVESFIGFEANKKVILKLLNSIDKA